MTDTQDIQGQVGQKKPSPVSASGKPRLTAAERRRLQRARKKLGIKTVRVSVKQDPTINKLIARGALPAEPSQAEIERAITDLIKDVGEMLANEVI